MANTDNTPLSNHSCAANGCNSVPSVLPDGKHTDGSAPPTSDGDSLSSVLKDVLEFRAKMPGAGTQPEVEAAQQTDAPSEDSTKSNECGAQEKSEAAQHTDAPSEQSAKSGNECGTQAEAEAAQQTDAVTGNSSPKDNECALKFLYEGPPKCRCCINWVEMYPDDLRESVEEREDIKAKAIVARAKKNHEDGTPLALDSIVVQNDDLRAFLSELFEGYEGITLKLKKLVLKAPFHPFFYRWDRFTEMKKQAEEEHSKASPSASLLYHLLRLELQPLIDEVKDLVKNEVITYKLLWAIFKPFERLYEKHHSHDRMHIYQKSAYVQSDKGDYFQIMAKFVDWDGQQFGYRSTAVAIREFAGTKPIRELDIYPFDFHPSSTEVRQTLLERGKKFRELCAVQHKSYTGSALVLREDQQCYERLTLDQRVMLDGSLYREKYSQPSLTSLDEQSFAPKLDLQDRQHIEPKTESHSHGLASTGHGMLTNSTSTRQSKSLKTAVRALKDEELILCHNMVAAYALTLKKWVLLTDINSVRPIHWNKTVFSKLVLPASHKDLVLSFIEAHISGDVQFDDIVEGKGLGLLMLLAGDPGLGKTLTAEAVAERVQRPLYILSAGELGHDAEDVEEALEEILDMTAKWNAVLLLDECDVFLEERSSSRLDHNAIVAVFLRLLEYHKGIIIMTTNRAESIDRAFKSRIHLTLRYPSLNVEAKATIWRQFVQGTRWAPGDTLTDEQYQKLATLPLNGREIKNIVKTAFLLASRSKSPLGLEHMRKVVDATMEEGVL